MAKALNHSPLEALGTDKDLLVVLEDEHTVRELEPDFPLLMQVERRYLRGLRWAIFNGKDKLGGLDYLLKAHNLDSKNISIINDISVAYMGLFDLEMALNYVQQALNIDPQNRLSNSIHDEIKDLQKRWPKSL